MGKKKEVYINTLDEAVEANRQYLINLENDATQPEFGPNGVVYVAVNGGKKAKERAENLAKQSNSVVITRP